MSANPQKRVNDDNAQIRSSRQAHASEYRQQRRRSSQQQNTKPKQAKKKKQTREVKEQGLPVWLTISLVLASALIALVAGLMIGYSVLGGKNPLQALNFDTWQHLYRMVFG